MKKIIIITISILLVISLVIFGTLYFPNHNSTEITKVDKKSNIEISIPKTNDKNFDKQIKNYINNIQNSYPKETNDNDSLKVSYDYTSYNNITTYHIISLKNINNEESKEDKIYYYDTINKKEVSINDLIYDLKLFNERLKPYIKEQLSTKENIFEDINYTFDYISFSDTKFNIVYFKDKISDKEILLSFEYTILQPFFNKDYFEFGYTKEEYNEYYESTKYDNKKLIALTFDDGPSSSTTPILLDALKERNIHVTFFMLGNMAYNNRDIVLRAYNEGHTVGSHTLSHKNLNQQSEEGYSYEISRGVEIIEEIINDKVKFIRPPYGNYKRAMLEKFPDYKFVLWNVDTEDWRYKDTEYLTNKYTEEGFKDGDIVLFHDIHPTSVEAIIKIIDNLSDQDYVFVSLDEMYQIRDGKITTNQAIYSLRLTN